MSTESLEMYLAGWLVQRREAKGISQEALGAQLGHSQSYVAKLEAGKLRVTLTAFVEIVSALGVSEAEVLSLIKELRDIAMGESLW
jgi:predicted transcriptional regulator